MLSIQVVDKLWLNGIKLLLSFPHYIGAHTHSPMCSRNTVTNSPSIQKLYHPKAALGTWTPCCWHKYPGRRQTKIETNTFKRGKACCWKTIDDAWLTWDSERKYLTLGVVTGGTERLYPSRKTVDWICTQLPSYICCGGLALGER